MTRYFQILNHAAERKTFVIVPEEDDDYKTDPRQRTSMEDIQKWREEANFEVKEVEIEEVNA